MEFFEENPDRVKEADIVVGIPSLNEARLIPYPTQQASLGLRQYFHDKRSVIINFDNDSTDGTKEAFLGTETEVPKVYVSTPPGIQGKGNNVRNFFWKACELGAKACIIIDADLKSITPRWIKNLADPLFQDFGFVAPLYVRHKYDGTITNSIAYPLIRSIYGRRVRQPIGGDLGFSGELARIYLEHPIWDERVADFGIDIWMTTVAICQNIPICQSFLGRPKIHKVKGPEIGATRIFHEIVGTLFSMMNYFDSFWRRVRWSKPTAIFGFGLGEVELPPPAEIDKDAIYNSFHKAVEDYENVWESMLGPEIFSKLGEVIETDASRFDFPSDLWAKVLFAHAIAYRRKQSDLENILNSLIPLYHASVYSYVLKTEEMSTQQAEEYIEEQCMVFEEARSYLDERWDN
jgi:glucosylglycerate synthase